MTSDDFTSWRKASYSGGDSNCVEIAAGWRSWRKASYSAGDSNCVEVGVSRQIVGVRDSKQGERGPVLGFPLAAWQAFIATAAADRV
jgi:hypothetical protein